MNLFTTAFLGLIVGVTAVELNPPEGTALLRVLLDNEIVVELDQPPWRVTVDLGDRLTPHRIRAVALDAKSEVLADERQWINLPTGPARAGVELRRGERGKVGLALRWAHVMELAPHSLRLEINGDRVDVEDPAWIEIPDSEAELDLIRAEVEFPDDSIATADAVLQYGELIAQDVEITAIPVRSQRQDRVSAQLRGVKANGVTPTIVGLEKGPAQIVLVVDPTAEADLERLLEEASATRRRRRADRGHRVDDEFRVLEESDWIKFVWPTSSPVNGVGRGRDLLDYSRDLTSSDGNLLQILDRVRPPTAIAADDIKVSEGVAVAGMLAAARSRRRAVVLVLGEARDPKAFFSSQQVLGYLRDLRVPLLVWKVGSVANQSPWAQGARQIEDGRDMEKAVRRLRELLDQQTIAWIRGLYLPQEVEVESRRRRIDLQ